MKLQTIAKDNLNSYNKKQDKILDEHIQIEVQEENERLAQIDQQKAEIIKKENRFSEPAYKRVMKKELIENLEDNMDGECGIRRNVNAGLKEVVDDFVFSYGYNRKELEKIAIDWYNNNRGYFNEAIKELK